MFFTLYYFFALLSKYLYTYQSYSSSEIYRLLLRAMPRHEEWSPDESRRKKHKKHKHKYAGSDNDQTSQKKSKHKIRSPDLRPDSPEIPPKKLPRTRSPALSPDRHTSKNKLRKRDYQRSPDRPRIKEERKDRYSDDFSRRTDDSQDRRYHQNHRGIKQEEDFDRRQEELRERRRGNFVF